MGFSQFRSQHTRGLEANWTCRAVKRAVSALENSGHRKSMWSAQSFKRIREPRRMTSHSAIELQRNARCR